MNKHVKYIGQLPLENQYVCLSIHRCIFARTFFHTSTTFILWNAKTTQEHQGISRGEWRIQSMAGGKGKAIDKGVGKGKAFDKCIEPKKSTQAPRETDIGSS